MVKKEERGRGKTSGSGDPTFDAFWREPLMLAIARRHLFSCIPYMAYPRVPRLSPPIQGYPRSLLPPPTVLRDKACCTPLATT